MSDSGRQPTGLCEHGNEPCHCRPCLRRVNGQLLAENAALRGESVSMQVENSALRHAIAMMLMDADTENDDPVEVSEHVDAARAALKARTA